MIKREADNILLACRKHGLSLTMRKEGSVYIVIFINRIEIKSYEAAKLITNALVIEGKHKTKTKEILSSVDSYPSINISNRPKKKKNIDDSSSFAERRSKFNE